MMPEKLKVLTFTLLGVFFLSYTAVLYTNPPFGTAFNEKADRGKMVWQQYNCQSCHQIYGLGGYLGPDLTNVYSRGGPEYIKAFVMSGPGAMPAFKLTDTEMNDLVQFLENIDHSGISDPRSYRIYPNGNIEQK